MVINAGEIVLSGSKAEKKVYYHHSGYPGGLRESKFLELMERHPERAVELAIKGNVAKEPTRPTDVSQAQGLCWAESSSCGTATGGA